MWMKYMADIVVWRITSLWLYKPLHKCYVHGTQVSHLNGPFKSPDFKFIQIKYMCVCIHTNIHVSVYSCTYFTYSVCVWYKCICTQTFLLLVFLSPGAGYLAVCIPLESASIAGLILHSATSCSSMATQHVLALGELQQDIAHVPYRLFF